MSKLCVACGSQIPAVGTICPHCRMNPWTGSDDIGDERQYRAEQAQRTSEMFERIKIGEAKIEAAGLCLGCNSTSGFHKSGDCSVCFGRGFFTEKGWFSTTEKQCSRCKGSKDCQRCKGWGIDRTKPFLLDDDAQTLIMSMEHWQGVRHGMSYGWLVRSFGKAKQMEGDWIGWTNPGGDYFAIILNMTNGRILQISNGHIEQEQEGIEIMGFTAEESIEQGLCPYCRGNHECPHCNSEGTYQAYVKRKRKRKK